MRRRGQIRIGQAGARKPVAGAHQPADIRQMVLYIGARGTHRLGIGGTATLGDRNKALVDTLAHQWAAHFFKELVVEPAGQPAHLDTSTGFGRHQPGLRRLPALRLIEIFGDGGGAGNGRHALFDQDRRGAGGIELEELRPPLPYPLLRELYRKRKLVQRQPDKARMRAEWVMEQRQHAVASMYGKSSELPDRISGQLEFRYREPNT
jgi:hypothetical protein